MTDYLFSQLNDSQLYALAIIPKITGTLSWVGSLSIICHCLSPAGKLNTQKRLLCVLSLGDMMCSIGQIVSTWAIPSDTIYDSFVKFNIGNQLTCNVQGFLLQFGSVLALFNNVFLCINYLLRGRHKWSIAKIASKAEPIFHAIGFLVSIFLSLVPLFYEMYNPGITRCWIIEYPLLCTKKDDRECIRGEKAFMFRTIVAIIAITCFIFMIVSFKLLYNAVKMEEEKLRSTSSEEDREDEGDRNSMHKKISRESLFYLVPFFIVYAPFVFATFIFTSLKTNATAVFIMFLFLVTCMPIQVRKEGRKKERITVSFVQEVNKLLLIKF